MKYNYGILGGTFDRFHAGHKALIKAACLESEKVDIGVTTEKFYKNKILAHLIETYEIREESVKQYLREEGFEQKVTIVQLEDIYGNALKNKEIDAIFVTKDTEDNAKHINEKRQAQEFSPLQIITIPFVLSEDGQPVTAERIRRGEIDREGQVYKNLFKNNLQLPATLREELRKPIGEIVTSLRYSGVDDQSGSSHSFIGRDDIIVTVGDIVTLAALDAKITPALSIVDLKTQRQNLDEKDMKEKLDLKDEKQKNDPGTINKHAVEIMQQKINQYILTKVPQVMLIDGEEDLLTLPAILLSPLNSKVIYGQVGQGAVIVEVTERKKQKISKLITQFN